ncbi:MAG: hybrid sensor histidine kinase/response regulator [Paenibacillaceae bacterium]|jgi:signal transduction histidine kinase|nr:hybrid sensor histidine kinase/response regulator [Paenibacillaceae bacterium]
METMEPVQILLVDDHPENLLALEAVLQDDRYSLVRASSGQEALRKVLQGDFAVIVMDVQMPEMDGFETAKFIKMRGKSKDTPIIFITAAEQSSSIYSMAYSVGAIDYIRKPFLPEMLKSKIDGFVRLHISSQRLAHQAALLQKQTEELERANREAIEASLVKTRFLATMSHELRTPMNGVMGVADLLLSTELTDEQRMYVETILNSGGALLRIMNDILDFSKMESGRMKLIEMPFDLNATVAETAELFLVKARQKEINLEIGIEPGTPRLLYGDDNRLRQILINLIGNAVKFTDSGEIHIGARCLEGPVSDCFSKQTGKAESGEKRECYHMEFRITDTGEGIPPKREGELFRPFTQLSPYMTRKHEGTGLGLSICKFLVELMGGKIWYEPPADGPGSVFAFTLWLSSVDMNASVSELMEEGSK